MSSNAPTHQSTAIASDTKATTGHRPGPCLLRRDRYNFLFLTICSRLAIGYRNLINIIGLGYTFINANLVPGTGSNELLMALPSVAMSPSGGRESNSSFHPM